MEITLNLPENVYRNFTILAEKKRRRIEDVITDRLQDNVSADDREDTVSGWPDEDVLALANLKLPAEQADRMSELLDRQQAGLISNVEKSELEMYLEIYNNANLRKAHGIVESVKRGLITSSDELK
jgi:NCAIR mutase (PurE)-related protein